MCQIGNVQCNVMQSLAPLLQESGNHGIGTGWLQQLDAALAHRNHGDFHFLVCDYFLADHAQSQFLIKLSRLLERLHCNSEMIDHVGHENQPLVVSTWYLAAGFWLLASRSANFFAAAVCKHPHFAVLRASVSPWWTFVSSAQAKFPTISSTSEYGSRRCSAISAASRAISSSPTCSRNKRS